MDDSLQEIHVTANNMRMDEDIFEYFQTHRYVDPNQFIRECIDYWTITAEERWVWNAQRATFSGGEARFSSLFFSSIILPRFCLHFGYLTLWILLLFPILHLSITNRFFPFLTSFCVTFFSRHSSFFYLIFTNPCSILLIVHIIAGCNITNRKGKKNIVCGRHYKLVPWFRIQLTESPTVLSRPGVQLVLDERKRVGRRNYYRKLRRN